MWIQVRSMDGKKTQRISGLSKLTKIEELRELLVNKFNAPVERQRLFYRGKQLEDGHTLFDYNVGLNDIIQILVREVIFEKENTPLPREDKLTSKKNEEINKVVNVIDKENESESKQSSNLFQDNVQSRFYKVGDAVDAMDMACGGWFEAKIIAIAKVDENLFSNTDVEKENAQREGKVLCAFSSNENSSNANTAEKSISEINGNMPEDDGLLYSVAYDEYEEEGPAQLKLKYIRPRAKRTVDFDEIRIGDIVMVNYNQEDPKGIGHWYDLKVTEKTQKELIGTLFINPEKNIFLENCIIHQIEQIFAVKLINEKAFSPETVNETTNRLKPVNCIHCQDNPTKKCKECSCVKCGGKDSPEKQILCDECEKFFHLWCVIPPLENIPETDEWYCPDCKNDETEIVRPGEKVKTSKKKLKMASAKSSKTRDWGKGMACVGRSAICTVVPPNHFGPIPGVEVGSSWKFRVQVSESGVHRPHVSGIHGTQKFGAYSIVLSGGYEDDLDLGDEFFYTGSGGRDLSGNKRTNVQSSDQTLTNTNLALAKNCPVPVNKNGAEAKDWKKGKPVRVVRNYKARKHSKYAPKEGNRYDGIYKVVKYWPEKGKSGFMVWRYLLRRDDANPAPWTTEGKKRIQQLGLEMQYPEGYQEEDEKQTQKTPNKRKKKQQYSDTSSDESSLCKQKSTKKIKNKQISSNSNSESSDEGYKDVKTKTMKRQIYSDNSSDETYSPKQQNIDYKIPEETLEKMMEDVPNKTLWDECKTEIKFGYQKFLLKVEKMMMCICCHQLLYEPITTDCKHNICKSCLKMSFTKCKVYTCPVCRFDLGRNCKMEINKVLQEILIKLFPGYDAGR